MCKLVFNLNVMESIQAKYGSVQKWGKLTDNKNGEPNAKALIFGFTEMINEAIEIENDEKQFRQTIINYKTSRKNHYKSRNPRISKKTK